MLVGILNKDMDGHIVTATNLDFIAEFISVDAFEYQIPCLAKTVKLQRADKLVPRHATREKTVILPTITRVTEIDNTNRSLSEPAQCL